MLVRNYYLFFQTKTEKGWDWKPVSVPKQSNSANPNFHSLLLLRVMQTLLTLFESQPKIFNICLSNYTTYFFRIYYKMMEIRKYVTGEILGASRINIGEFRNILISIVWVVQHLLQGKAERFFTPVWVSDRLFIELTPPP